MIQLSLEEYELLMAHYHNKIRETDRMAGIADTAVRRVLNDNNTRLLARYDEIARAYLSRHDELLQQGD